MVKKESNPDLSFVTFQTLCISGQRGMRRYCRLDTRGLVRTGRWKDQRSAARYEHVVVSEETRKADLLPRPNKVYEFSTDSSAEFRHVHLPAPVTPRSGMAYRETAGKIWCCERGLNSADSKF